jgi:hypothetical protein
LDSGAKVGGEKIMRREMFLDLRFFLWFLNFGQMFLAFGIFSSVVEAIFNFWA